MIFYPHYIGAFDKATRHLTRIERSIYRDLIDMYYDTEKPLMLDIPKLCRLILARSNEEVTAVEQVLNEFFIETPDGWRNFRCDEEIDKYYANTSQKALAGKASAAAREAKRQQTLEQQINGRSTAVQQPFNGESTNKNQNKNYESEPDKPIEVITTTQTNQVCMSSQKTAPPQKKATRLPADWFLPKEWGDWAMQEFPHLTPHDVRQTAEMFKDHWIANASRATGKKDDWQATWRNWVRKSHPNRSGIPRGGGEFKSATQRRADEFDRAAAEFLADGLNELKVIEVQA